MRVEWSKKDFVKRVTLFTKQVYSGGDEALDFFNAGSWHNYAVTFQSH